MRFLSGLGAGLGLGHRLGLGLGHGLGLGLGARLDPRLSFGLDPELYSSNSFVSLLACFSTKSHCALH